MAGDGDPNGQYMSRASDTFCSELERTLPLLLPYALSLTRDRDHADDLLQDCAERALSNWERFEPGTNLRAWLAKMMRNLHLNARRRETRAPFEPNADIADCPDPRTVEDHSLTWDILRAGIDKLSVQYREIVLLSIFDDLIYEELSAVLSVPVGTVRSRLSRGRTQMALALKTGADA